MADTPYVEGGQIKETITNATVKIVSGWTTYEKINGKRILQDPTVLHVYGGKIPGVNHPQVETEGSPVVVTLHHNTGSSHVTVSGKGMICLGDYVDFTGTFLNTTADPPFTYTSAQHVQVITAGQGDVTAT